MNKKKIHNLSNIFKMYNNIEEIYNAIIKLIEEKNFKIEADINEIKLKLFIPDKFNGCKEMEIKLNKDENKDEYIKLLSREILNIRNEEKKLKEENKNIREELKKWKELILEYNDIIKNKKDNIETKKDKNFLIFLLEF